MFDLHDQQAAPFIHRRRRAYCLPHSVRRALSSGLDKLSASVVSRSWCVPATAFPDEVKHYRDRHKTLNARGPRPRLRTAITDDLSTEVALKIDAALNFAELGVAADPFVKPILLYYSCAHLCGVYTRAFFEWDCDTRTHGLSCSHKPNDVANTKVTIESAGQFARLAATCFLLTGQASYFSQLVTYASSPSTHVALGELLHHFGNEEIGGPVAALSVEELLGFDFGSRLKAVRVRHGFHKYRGLPTTAFLLDVAILFVASSLARYDVLGWRQVLEGKSNSFRILFEEAYSRFLLFGVDALLRSIDEPLLDFDQRLRPSQPSPYSHDDRSRFSHDPNCAG